MKSAFTISDHLAMVRDGRIICAAGKEQFYSSTDQRVHDFIEGVAPVEEDVETLLQA